MRGLLFVSFLSMFSVKNIAQDVDGLLRHSLSVTTSIDAGSEKLSAKFIDKYLRGGYIDQATKEAFFNNLSSINSAGAISSTELNLKKYTSRSEGKNRSYQMVGLENYYLYEAEFTKDLFGLYFYGNQKYENAKADLSNMQFTQIKFQVFKFGAYQRLSRFGIGVNAGIVLGQNYLTIETQQSDLFTAPQGKYLEINLQGKSISTDIDKDKLFSTQGKGLSVDLKLDYFYSGQSKVTVQINRLGFVQWNDRLEEQFVDSSYKFEGIVVKNIIDSFAFDFKSPKEFKEDLVHSKLSSNRRKVLPVQISVLLQHWFIEDKLWLNGSYSMLPNTLYKPSFQCDLNYKLLNILSLGLDAGIGGYSSWNMGLNAGIKLTKLLSVNAQARSLFNVYDLNKPASVIGGVRVVLGF